MFSWANLDPPTGSSSYTSLYNVLDFPVGVVPVTTVTLQDEEELAFYKGYYGDSNDRNFKEVSVPLPQEHRLVLILASIPVDG